jgi:hypothetical protein
MGKKSRSVSEIRNWDEYPGPDHISESLETIFWVKILQFFDADADPGAGNFFFTLDPGWKNSNWDQG